MTSPLAALRRYPTTVAVCAATAAVGALQFFTPVLSLFERDPQQLAAGQLWRLATSMFVQGEGWGQFVFNVLGLALVGGAIEAKFGARGLLIVYFAGGVAAGATVSLWFPDQVDSGSSAGVASLIGALTLGTFLTRAGCLLLLCVTRRVPSAGSATTAK